MKRGGHRPSFRVKLDKRNKIGHIETSWLA